MAGVANRYVIALSESAKSMEENTIFEKGLKEISNLFNSDEKFKNVLLNPRIENQEKLNIIKEIFPEYNNEIFINFISLLIKEKRISIIEDISDEYTKLYDSLNKNLKIKIIAAMKPEKEQIEAITKKYKNLYKVDKVEYEVEIDEAIIGGVKVIVGNKIYDNSIKTRIENMF